MSVSSDVNANITHCAIFTQGKRNEAARKAEFIAQLKAQYKSKMERNPSVDARPWRK